MSKIVSGLFDSYVKAVYDEPLGEMQMTEIERAFYAGSKSTIDTLQLATDEGDEPTERDLQFMDAFYAELEEFGDKVAATVPEPVNANEAPPPALKPEHQLGDMPIEEQHRTTMQAIAMTLDEFLNPGATGTKRENGFVLLVFKFGVDKGRCNYISNGADRLTIADLMEEQAKRFREHGHG